MKRYPHQQRTDCILVLPYKISSRVVVVEDKKKEFLLLITR